MRPDNMGDLIMTSPALRALKESFNCHITLLTSSLGCKIAPYISSIDEVMVHDFPWVQTNYKPTSAGFLALAEQLRAKYFDAMVVFSVYSQSSLPTALLGWMAGIPKRAAYSRENPYSLLTTWIPDAEPFNHILHQVERDLKLVESVGAHSGNDLLQIDIDPEDFESAKFSLKNAGIKIPEQYIIFHPGVSEAKREYPVQKWKSLLQEVISLGYPILFTGARSEQALVENIIAGMRGNIINTAGLLNIGEYVALIDRARLVVSVNTATVHIAAARQTPVVVLYALTNPQHTPWKVNAKVFPYSVESSLKSKNTIINYVNDVYFGNQVPLPEPGEIINGIRELLLDGERIQHVSIRELISC